MRTLLVVFFLIFLSINVFPQNEKMNLWKTPSYFRGFNVLWTKNRTYLDFISLKYAGANFAYIGIDGFYNPSEPYSRNNSAVIATDSMTHAARFVGLYYAITLRSGPGRIDVSLESHTGLKSTVWNNPIEQQLYAGMVAEITKRYINDPYFVGIAPIMEPNPLFDKLYTTPDILDSLLKLNNIDANKFNQLILDSIRKVSKDIPVILQCVAYSCPEFYSLMEINNDTNIVYEFHSYRPNEYVKDTNEYSLYYPGNYISFYNLSYKYHDKAYISDSIYYRVREFQKKSQAPVILGEFGLTKRQNGGVQFLNDISNICIESGWHFAYWLWRDVSKYFNYEYFGGDYWKEVKASFKATVDIKENYTENSNIFCYPNPSADVLEICTKNPDSEYITLKLFDIFGKQIATVYNGFSEVNLSINFETEDIPSGTYFLVLSTTTEKTAYKISIIK
ncbi:MAG: T9SS type A sorting domain-containing protein [bacterium]